MAGWDGADEELDAAFANAERAGTQALASEPRALAARYDEATGRLVVDLVNGATFLVPTDLIEGLAGADAASLAEVEVIPGGEGLHWEALDADISVPGLLAGLFGSRAWMQEMSARRAG